MEKIELVVIELRCCGINEAYTKVYTKALKKFDNEYDTEFSEFVDYTVELISINYNWHSDKYKAKFKVTGVK